MSFADVLNTDVGAVGSRLSGFFRWWLHELAEMARPLLVQRGRKAASVAERGPDGRYVVRDSAGVPVRDQAKARDVIVLLGADEAVVRDAPAPRVPDRDILQSVGLDLDRLTPFPPEAAYQRVSLLPPIEQGGRPFVRIGAVSRVLADERLAAAQHAGLKVAGLAVRAPDGVMIDFLPAMRRRGSGDRRAAIGWVVVGLLVLANVALAIWRDTESVARLQRQVDAQRPAVSRLRSLRVRTDSLRNDLEERSRALAAQEAVSVLDNVAGSLPSGSVVRRLSWNGRELHVVGGRRPGSDVAAALAATPMFRAARNTSPDTAQPDDAFDVSAPVARPPARRP